LVENPLFGEDGEEGEREFDIDWYGLNVKNWPEEDGDPIDMENHRVVKFNNKELIIIAGGDWQQGCAITIEAVNGCLVATKHGNPADYAKFRDLLDEDIYQQLDL
jgi:hypothetical protein